MKRIAVAVLTGALLSGGATWAWASHAADDGAPLPGECADVHAGTDITADSGYDYSRQGVLTVQVALAGPSCLAADYTMVVYDESPTAAAPPVILDAVSVPGDGTTSTFRFQRTVIDDDGLLSTPKICVNVTASTTEHVASGTDSGSTSTSPTGKSGAPPMQDSDSDTNSIDTETVVDWWDAEGGPCVTIDLGTGSGGRTFG